MRRPQHTRTFRPDFAETINVTLEDMMNASSGFDRGQSYLSTLSTIGVTVIRPSVKFRRLDGTYASHVDVPGPFGSTR